MLACATSQPKQTCHRAFCQTYEQLNNRGVQQGPQGFPNHALHESTESQGPSRLAGKYDVQRIANMYLLSNPQPLLEKACPYLRVFFGFFSKEGQMESQQVSGLAGKSCVFFCRNRVLSRIKLGWGNAHFQEGRKGL